MSKQSELPSSETHSSEVEARLRAMLDATPLAVHLWDEEGNLVDCNQEALRMFGMKDKAEYFARFWETKTGTKSNIPLVMQETKERIAKAFSTGYLKFESLSRNPTTGEMIPVETTVVRVPWGGKFRLASYIRDLRDLIAKEAEAAEANERAQVMLNTLPFSAFLFDTECNLVDCNQRTMDLFGAKDKAVFCKTFLTHMPEYQSDGQKSGDKAVSIIRKAFDTGRSESDWEHLTEGGDLLPVHVYLIRVKWRNGWRVLGYHRDLTQLRESQDYTARYSALLDASPDLALYLHGSGVIEYANPAASEISGYAPGELIRKGLSLLFAPDELRRITETVLPTVRLGKARTFETEIIRKDGSRRQVEVTMFATKLHDRKMGIGVSAQDITERIAMQKELVEAKDLAEEGLIQAERYINAKNNLLSKMSHEMRTPMNAILGMNAIAKATTDESRRQHCYAQIDESCGKMLDMINDILDIVRLQSGGFELGTQKFSLKAMLASLATRTRLLADEKRIFFTSEIDSAIPEKIAADEPRLKQALGNILNNAVKFTPENGRVEFLARFLGTDEKGKYQFRFDISDTGIGMDDETRRSLWDLFEQADNGITRGFGGIGLGLPVAKQIVDLMGGTIEVESSPGQGSRFSIMLSFSSADSVQAAPPTPLFNLKILIVDDVDINREITMALFEETGAITDEARDGIEAVEKFEQNDYDVILMDLHMPRMDGFEATKKIRASSKPAASKVKIIAITADSGGDVTSRCFASGMNAHVGKPVDMNALMEALS